MDTCTWNIFEFMLGVICIDGLLWLFCRVRSYYPAFKNQVNWEQYLGKLRPEDQKNVEKICARLTSFSQYHQLPLGILAVGSVLNPHQGAPYTDIDLVLLPLLEKDIDWAEEMFTNFVRAQKELKKNKIEIHDGKKYFYQHEERRWSRCLGRYELSHYWDLEFPEGGKNIQLFIRTEGEKTTLFGASKETDEGEEDLRTYAYKIIR